MDAATHKALDSRGVHTSTFDCDCVRCKCDLFLSAVVSPAKPGVCACLEHWQDVGEPAGGCVILYRCVNACVCAWRTGELHGSRQGAALYCTGAYICVCVCVCACVPGALARCGGACRWLRYFVQVCLCGVFGVCMCACKMCLHYCS